MKIPIGILKQVLLATSASLGYLAIGLIRGWSSTAIPSMQNRDGHLIPDEDSASWISAVPPLGAFLASLSTGPLLHHLGRKKTLMLSGPLFIIGWVILGAGKQLYVLIIGRVITGICAGLVTPSAQVYVCECAYPEIRGILGSLPALFMTLGVLLSYIFGAWLEWHHLAYVSALFPAAMLVLLTMLPESPVWLRDHNKHKEADEAMEWLNRKEKKIDGIPQVLVVSSGLVVDSKLNNTTKLSMNIKCTSVKILNERSNSMRSVMQRSVLIPSGLVVAILIFQETSGIDTIIFYTVSIFQASGSSVDGYTATIIVGLIQVLATFFSMFLIDRTGRKPLLLISGFLMTVSMSVLGGYFYIKETNPTLASEFRTVPIISLIMFMTAFAIGYCNIPFLLMGELLPLGQRSFMSSVAGAANLGSMFLVIKTYPNIKDMFGAKGVFFIYAAFCFLSCVFVLAFLPETKQKTLEEIELYFKTSNKSTIKDNLEKGTSNNNLKYIKNTTSLTNNDVKPVLL